MLRKIRIFSFVIFCVIVLFVLTARFYTHWSDALTTHTLVQKDNSHLEYVWQQTVFTSDFSSRQLAATKGKVFFVGSVSQYGPRALVALDGETGNKLWQVPEALTVDVSPEMVYVDYRDSVVAYTLMGEKVWRTKLPARNIGYFNVVDEKLYVNTGGYYILDAATGELLASLTYPNPELVMYYWNTAIFIEHRVFRGGETILDLEAVAINRQSGDILWKTAGNVISNIAATNSLAFVVTDTDELQILNAKTGKLLETIQIDPSINFYELAEETNVQHEGYFLAVDQTNQLLYVLLGDSNQLFAFKINR